VLALGRTLTGNGNGLGDFAIEVGGGATGAIVGLDGGAGGCGFTALVKLYATPPIATIAAKAVSPKIMRGTW
jgi:hypothetical protein